MCSWRTYNRIRPTTTTFLVGQPAFIGGMPVPIQLRTLPKFTTFPPVAAKRDFRFVVTADVTGGREAPAYVSALDDDPVFFLQIGDLDHRDPAKTLPLDINNWRQMHRDNLWDSPAGNDLACYIMPSVPIFHIWDDHDYGENNADKSASWKDLATQAFTEYFPLPDLGNSSRGLWYRFSYAQAELFVLDTRSQRDAANDTDDETKSMIDGDNVPNDQKDWLKNQLLGSNAVWKFIVSSSAWNPNSKVSDSWSEFQTEQLELVDFINDNNIENVVVITGDIHSGGCIDDGTNSHFPEISIPTTNLMQPPNGCSGHTGCGTWSEIVIDDLAEPGGYGVIDIIYEEATDTHRCILRIMAQDGTERFAWEVPTSP